jgi:hypothetical protein
VKTLPGRPDLPSISCRSVVWAAALCISAMSMLTATLRAQSPYSSNADFAAHARLLRENALLRVEPQVFVPTSSPRFFSRSPWKENIVTTVFWTGERPTKNNPTPNHASSWDPNWADNYGGYDDPDPATRRNFIPINFVPRQNPFYCALPYNDVTRGTTKPESRVVIPWFNQTFVQEGKSVCKGRWVAIRHGNRIAYAQWEDCGPFRTDHYQYVFGNDRPLPNLNAGAGLDVSPAVRDYLGMGVTRDVCSWRFVEANEVPSGPWRLYGDNNTFVNNRLRSEQRVQGGNSSGNPLFGR